MHRKELKLPWLFLGSLITNTGISFIWPLTTIYMHEYLHESLTVSGLVLLINSLATMGGNYVGGRLFDRWKPYPTILGGITINIVATLSLIFFHGWPAYPLLLILLGLGNGVVATGVNAYATLVTSRKPSYVFNVLYFMSNLGLVIGTLIVGFVLPFGITYIFILACALFVLDRRVSPFQSAKTATRQKCVCESYTPANCQARVVADDIVICHMGRL